MDWAELFTYNEETGRLHWKVKFCRKIKPGDVAGSKTGDGYWRINIHGRVFRAHRIIWDILYPEDKLTELDEIDHIDHNPLNNKRDNLRKVDRKTNGRNVSIGTLNTSGTVGVYWKNREQKWLAQIKVNQKSIHLGYFSDKNDAVAARKKAELKYNFHKNHGK
ncbi:HNH endonuclease [Salmonella enterica subsp. enterica serovar Thompson]|nr:HNH endonuclease [Salmonella enterica]EIC6911813.1 HNH endonuclease [Salmonella enterica subsp. enterica serovar Infantis]